MGKNIIGENLEAYVRGQINVRQSKLSNIGPDASSQQAYYAKSPYIRLTSSVNLLDGTDLFGAPTKSFINATDIIGNLFGVDTSQIEQNAINYFEARSILKKLENLGIDKSLLKGNNLAKNCILQGGVTKVDFRRQAGPDGQTYTLDDITSAKFTQNSDLNRGTDIFSGAYGWGGIGERGFVPMPGITNVQTKYYNNGALSQATINIRCYSKLQFAIIDALYLRPGYTLLLEFGHSKFFINETSSLTSYAKSSLAMRYFLEGVQPSTTGATKFDQFDLYNKIEAVRKSTGGNYEAVYGYISKFSWRFNAEGFYECTVSIIGMGSIIESLQNNDGVPSPKVLKASVNSGQSDPYLKSLSGQSKSLLHGLLIHTKNRVRTVYRKSIPSFGNTTTFSTAGWKHYAAAVAYQTTSTRSMATGPFMTGNTPITTTNDHKLYMGTLSSQLKGIDLNYDGITGSVTMQEDILAVMGIKNTDATAMTGVMRNAYQAYVKLGTIVAMLQLKCLIYDEKNTPFFRFDMNHGGPGERFKDDENFYFSSPGSTSGNPKICLVPTRNTPQGYKTMKRRPVTDLLKELIAKGVKDYLYEVPNEPYYCSLPNIFVNVDHALNVLDNHTNEDGEIAILDFLQKLLDDIFRALGGVTSIELQVTDDGLVKFINKVPPQYNQLLNIPPADVAVINTYGVVKGNAGSFVREIDLLSDLSPQFGTMIAVGAQVNGNQISSNSTSFSS